MTEYWFVRSKWPNVYRWRVVRPVTVEGWLVLAAGIAAMLMGGIVAVAVGGDQIARGWLGLGYGLWLIVCIAAIGTIINLKANPNRIAEEHKAQRTGGRK